MPIVYALVADFAPNEIRYIGRTKHNDPSKRLSQHLRRPNLRSSHKNNWIQETLKKGKVLAVIVEDGLTFEQSAEREIYWISFYKNLGHKLTNLTLGGEGCLGVQISEETRARMSVASKGRIISEETKRKLSAANKGKSSHTGKKQRPDWAEKTRKAHLGHKHTEETKTKIAQANKDRKPPSEETNNKTRLSVIKYWETKKLEKFVIQRDHLGRFS